MDVKRLFRSSGNRLLLDFAESAEIQHNGSKGTVREERLKNFLKDGRLPKKYAIGAGEVVGPSKDTSRQCDLIIYDDHTGLSFLTSDSVQVYPIESVYGIIEVKSSLSKEELIDSLEKIKALKLIAPRDTVVETMPGFKAAYQRPVPFGVVFSYSLSNNSLNSLRENLYAWEKENDPGVWPNLIVVLGEGVIYHLGPQLKDAIHNHDLGPQCYPLYCQYEKDTLFQFYINLIDLCSNTRVGPPNLRQYFKPAERMGSYIVRNHDRFQGRATNPGVYRLRSEFIGKIVEWCRLAGKRSVADLYIKQLGQIPQGTDGLHLKELIYHYDPECLPGIHEVDTFYEYQDGVPVATNRTQMPAHSIEVDGEVYSFPMAYVAQDDFEPALGMKVEDL